MRSSPAEPLLGGGPRYRPPAVLRAMLGLSGLLAAAFSAALMLSDRAPGVLRRLFGERAARWWERIDRANPELGDQVATQPDFVVHLLIWTAVAVLAVLTAWSWRALPVVAGGVAVLSLGIELAQGRWSHTREVEVTDAAANLLGVGIGTVAAIGAMLAWSALAALVVGARGSRRAVA